MWADTVLHAEQQHLLQLLFWSALSIVAGTAVATMLAVRRVRSPLLTAFAATTGASSLIIGAIAAADWHFAELRDVSGAARLERMVWMNIGLDGGYVAVGATLALAGWLLAKRPAVIGAGVGVMVQGLALLLLEMQFASVISR